MKKDKSNSKLLKFLSLWLSMAMLTVGMPMGAYAAEATPQEGIEEEAAVQEALLAEGDEGGEDPATPSENGSPSPS